jgi:hypothetical protein
LRHSGAEPSSINIEIRSTKSETNPGKTNPRLEFQNPKQYSSNQTQNREISKRQIRIRFVWNILVFFLLI